MLEQNISFDESDNTVSIHIDYRIRLSSLNPEIITSELGIHPTKSYAKGENYLGKKIDPNTKEHIEISRTRPWGMWMIDTKNLGTINKKTEDHILYLLEILEAKEKILEKYLLQKDKFDISFYIRWQPMDTYGSYEISGESLEKIGKLCHRVEFVFIHTDQEH